MVGRTGVVGRGGVGIVRACAGDDATGVGIDGTLGIGARGVGTLGAAALGVGTRGVMIGVGIRVLGVGTRGMPTLGVGTLGEAIGVGIDVLGVGMRGGGADSVGIDALGVGVRGAGAGMLDVVDGDANSDRASAPAAMVITPPHTEQRARTLADASFAGSTRNTERHSGQETFIGGLPLAPRASAPKSASRRPADCRYDGRSSTPILPASWRSSSFPLRVH